ncbi:DUF2911 domain-containing protein [Longimicrobium terrae]|uniref:DUF2911 domain-containing protein n=1 Tax=Longimicrobium terrae TaxID=1639882 RepID=A0A841GY63_9BACT|nr:DUF2911 domain-containing protein [Longimicrobium terrae]MBB4636315.1 hypothetical protein [Longimicrobium terrae]MBB6070711.1 hypothetical protein [Longimicrobium terrae]NNC29691.1 DUF2911 domain-containing protein [Longimicrobium terrae]
MKHFLSTAALAVLATGAALPAAAQDRGGFVVRLGRDTVAVEQYERTATHLRSQMVSRSPRTALRTLDAELRPDGSVSRMTVTTRVMNDSTLLPQVITVELPAGDSATVRIARGDTVRQIRALAPGAYPYISDSYAFVEHALHAARFGQADSVVVPMLSPGARAGMPVMVRRLGADSVTFTTPGGESRIRVDGRGRVMGVISPNSTRQVTVERVASIPVEAVAARFLQAERSGRAMGMLSPRDSINATVGGAQMSLSYGRPARRGRQIFGSVVKWGEVWRTGANEATSFRTSRDLMFGGTRVPAGAYTLWTIPGPQGWQLIINRKTGEWGTEYDASQDLARVPVQAARTRGEAVEQFTMRIRNAQNGGAIVMSWDDTEVTAPFTVAP